MREHVSQLYIDTFPIINAKNLKYFHKSVTAAIALSEERVVPEQ
jgi:hypothetical protein